MRLRSFVGFFWQTPVASCSFILTLWLPCSAKTLPLAHHSACIRLPRNVYWLNFLSRASPWEGRDIRPPSNSDFRLREISHAPWNCAIDLPRRYILAKYTLLYRTFFFLQYFFNACLPYLWEVVLHVFETSLKIVNFILLILIIRTNVSNRVGT